VYICESDKENTSYTFSAGNHFNALAISSFSFKFRQRYEMICLICYKGKTFCVWSAFLSRKNDYGAEILTESSSIRALILNHQRQVPF